MTFRDELTTLTPDQIGPGALPAGVLLAAEQITAGTLDPAVVAQAIAGQIVGAGNLEPESVTAAAIAANAIVAGAIAAGAIDGMTITGATLRTAAAGNRIEVSEQGSTGQIAFYPAVGAGGTPASIVDSSNPGQSSLAIAGGNAGGGAAGLTLRSDATKSYIDETATQVNVGNIAITTEVDVNASTIKLNGTVYRADKVHWEWTGPTNQSIGSGSPSGVVSLTKDAAKSIGSGPASIDAQTIKAGADGIYAVSLYVEFAAMLTARAYAELRVNNSPAARAPLTGDNAAIVSLPNVRLAAADAILPVLYQSNGAAVTENCRLRLTLLERL